MELSLKLMRILRAFLASRRASAGVSPRKILFVIRPGADAQRLALWLRLSAAKQL
jgi:hypothetical protein